MWLRSRVYDSNGQLRVDTCIAATLLFASLRQNDGPGVTSPWKVFSPQLRSKFIRIAHNKFYMPYAMDSSGNVGFNCLTVDRKHESTKVQDGNIQRLPPEPPLPPVSLPLPHRLSRLVRYEDVSREHH